MLLHGIDHYTVRCHPDDLGVLLDFYTSVLNLTPGVRPDFDFPGHWLYAGTKAVVHLAATDQKRIQTPGSTGQFDHVSFRTGGLWATREKLDGLGVRYEELPVPGMPLHQIFLRDPIGLKIELTFDSTERQAPAPKIDSPT